MHDRDEGLLRGIRKIAVLRANALGDFVVTLPALEALRAAYPDVEIVLLGRPWHAELMRHRPGPVDRVVTIPTRALVGYGAGDEDPSVLDQFFRAMQAERFDLALQLHGGGRNSNPFVQRLEARTTAGFRTPNAPALDRWAPYGQWQPEIWRYLEVVALVGAQPTTIRPRLVVTDADRAAVRAALPDDNRPLAVIHPGATHRRRRWPPESFAAVGDALAQAGARLILTGTDDERPTARAVAATMRAPAIDLCGRLSLSALVGFLDRASIMVSNDTGPRHIAEAVGTPSVAIYWCGNLLTHGPATRALHRPIVSWRIDCPVCGIEAMRSGCAHEASFVTDVPVDEVRDAALELLALGCAEPVAPEHNSSASWADHTRR